MSDSTDKCIMSREDRVTKQYNIVQYNTIQYNTKVSVLPSMKDKIQWNQLAFISYGFCDNG